MVESQGKLFDFVAFSFPDKDTVDFISAYMKSETRKSIDESQAYVNTMDYKSLWDYFLKTDRYELKKGRALSGFIPDWIGEFYSYIQARSNLSSKEILKLLPIKKLMGMVRGLHDLDYSLAYKKVGFQ